MIEYTGIFESVQFLNESKHDIIVSANDIVGNNADEAEAALRIRKTLIVLERNGMLTKDGSNAIKNKATSNTKCMIKGGSNRKILIRLANTIIETPSSNIEAALASFIKEAKAEASQKMKMGLAIASVANGGGFGFAF